MKVSRTKKIVSIICAISIVIIGCCSALIYCSVSSYAKEAELKAKNSTIEIYDAFHDQGDIYMNPVAPTKKDDITLRLRSDRYNITKAQVQYTLDNGVNWNAIDMDYEKRDKTGYYDIWKVVIPAQSKPFFYRFAVANDGSSPTMYYGTQGIKSYQIDTDEMFYVIPDFNTPKWSQGTMWYYAHLGQFNNGDTTNDLYREFLMYDGVYGNDTLSMHRGSGDIKGLKHKLDYIESLGAETLALGPFFSSANMYGFGVDNYASVETAFGNENDLIDLINEIHSRNMKITTDMVISYSVYDSKYFNMTKNFPTDGAYQSKNSAYGSLFKFPQWPFNFVKIWGSPGINVSENAAQKLLYKDNDSIVLRYLNKPYGLDGYRFDAEESVGNMGYDYDYKSIWKSIYSSVKSVSKDILILSENSSGIADQYNTLFDSSWQKNGYFAVKNWFEGKSNASQMIEVLQKNLINTARPRALSSYNFLGQHDVSRLFNDTKAQRNAISSALLLQMTFLGSPVIYYGDEIGLTNGEYDNQTASPFNWDKSTWDYNILNLIKSLGKLRKEYSCLKNGVIRIGEIDDAELFLSFGRFDKTGSVITLCNQQNSVVNREINVSQYNVKDGAVLTDYLTGNTYKVENGKISISVIPGGTVLVTGKQVSDYRGEYGVSNIGKNIDVVKNDTASFNISGKGKIGNKNDSIGLLTKEVYNNSFISAKVHTNKNSTAVITLRNSKDKDSAYYSVSISNKKLAIKARTSNGGKTKEIASAAIPIDCYIKISRENNNTFCAYYTDESGKAYKLVENSKVIFEGNETMLAGITTLKGSAEFSEVTVEALDSQKYDSFDSEKIGSMFDFQNNNFKIKDGKLILESSDNKVNILKTNAHSDDYTFKTQLVSFDASENNNAAGVIAYFSNDNYVFAGRTVIDGKHYLVLARMQNGKPVIKEKILEKDYKIKVTIQLQRIGNMYSAVYSYDEKTWNYIGYNLYCNYTVLNTGLFALNAKAEFEYSSFGNAINDNSTINYPINIRKFSTGYRNDLKNIESDRIVFVGDGTWEDIGAGYEQISDNGTQLLLCKNKLFNDVRAEATFVLGNNSGEMGIMFSKQTCSANTDSCYRVGVNKSGNITLYKDNIAISNAKIDVNKDGTRICVQRDNGYIHVFVGENSDLVISVYDNNQNEGYVAYYTDNMSGRVINYDITDLSLDWSRSASAFGTDDYIELVEAGSSLSLVGAGFTNGIMSFTLDNTSDIGEKGSRLTTDATGVLLCGNFDRKAKYGGVAITYSYFTGKLEASEYGKIIDSVQLNKPKTVNNAQILIEFSEGVFNIFANGSIKPVMTVKASVKDGGGVTVYCDGGKARFYNLDIEDVTNLSKYTMSDVWKNWTKTAKLNTSDLSVANSRGKAFSTDFSDYKCWINNMYKIKRDVSDWYIEDGLLKTDAIGANWNFATVTNGIYDDVDVSVKLRFTDYKKDSYSGLTLSICKQNMYAGNNDTGYTLKIFGNGNVYLYDNLEGKNLNGWNDYISKPDEFFTFRLVKKGNMLKAYLNEKQIFSGLNNSLNSGFIAIGCDYASAEFDDLIVK